MNQPVMGLHRNLTAPRITPGRPTEGVPSHYTMQTDSQPLQFRRMDGNYQKNYDVGSLVFLKTQTRVLLNSIFDLPTLRYTCNLSCNMENHRFNEELVQQSANGDENGPSAPNSNKRSRDSTFGQALDFLSTMDKFMDNITVAGILNGPADPYGQNSANNMDYGPIGSEVMVVPLVNYGHCYMPNFFGPLIPGQQLYMTAKPMPRDETSRYFYDPFMLPVELEPRYRIKYVKDAETDVSRKGTVQGTNGGLMTSIDADLAIDFEFHSSLSGEPPCSIESPMIMCENHNADPDKPIRQPCRSSKFYYTRDPEGGDVEIREGMVWRLGKNIYAEDDYSTKSAKDAMRKRYQTNDLKPIKKMEIMLDIKRLF